MTDAQKQTFPRKGRRFRRQMRPLERFRWRVSERMRGGELDRDLGTLLLAMSEDMERETPGGGVTVRGLQAQYLGLYERIELPETRELLTHSRAVSQLVALEKSIRAAWRADSRAGKSRRSVPVGDAPNGQRRKRVPKAEQRPAPTVTDADDEGRDDAPEASGGCDGGA